MAKAIPREEFEQLAELALDVVERIVALLDDRDGEAALPANERGQKPTALTAFGSRRIVSEKTWSEKLVIIDAHTDRAGSSMTANLIAPERYRCGCDRLMPRHAKPSKIFSPG